MSENDWNINALQRDIQLHIIIQEYNDVFEDFSEVGIYTAQRSQSLPRYFLGGIAYNNIYFVLVNNI